MYVDIFQNNFFFLHSLRSGKRKRCCYKPRIFFLFAHRTTPLSTAVRSDDVAEIFATRAYHASPAPTPAPVRPTPAPVPGKKYVIGCRGFVVWLEIDVTLLYLLPCQILEKLVAVWRNSGSWSEMNTLRFHGCKAKARLFEFPLCSPHHTTLLSAAFRWSFLQNLLCLLTVHRQLLPRHPCGSRLPQWVRTVLLAGLTLLCFQDVIPARVEEHLLVILVWFARGCTELRSFFAPPRR